MRRLISILGALTLFGCGEATDAPAETEALRLGQKWVQSQDFRRETLEDALWYRNNTYATTRLTQYAVNGGWDDLPVAQPTVVPVQPDHESLNFPEVEWTHEAIFELGERAFHNFPMRVDARLDAVANSRENAAEAGFWIDANERIGGLVRIKDSQQVAWTCAPCHSSVLNGDFIPGRSNAHIDAGAMYRVGGSSNAIAEGWGPGRIDPTADQTNNPSNIPDLRAIRFQTHLHWTGGLKNSLEALAIRVETLYIISARERVRPPRQVAFAVAYYLWHLASEDASTVDPVLHAEGKAIFDTHCGSCHGKESPGIIPQSEILTDDTLSVSPSRGTGHYRITSLHKVGTRGRLLHTGEFVTLDEMFDPERERSKGHIFGLDLSEDDRLNLLDYLETL